MVKGGKTELAAGINTGMQEREEWQVIPRIPPN